jgi:hypothetical protein
MTFPIRAVSLPVLSSANFHDGVLRSKLESEGIKVRIVTWNMNHCRRSQAQRGNAWEYLRHELHADLALVQEASPPEHLASVYRPIGENTFKWGSAVVALRSDLILRARPRVPLANCYLTPVIGDELPDSHPGACAVADVLDAHGRCQFTAVSL